MRRKKWPVQLYRYPATVERVIDGDTVVVLLDRGFGDWSRKTCRFSGINAPEPKGDTKLDGDLATDHLETLLEDHCDDKGRVIVVSREVDSFGRILGELIGMDGVDINLQMVADGHAVEYQP